MIKYTINTAPSVETHVREWLFPGGEVGVDINGPMGAYPQRVERVHVQAHLQSSNDVMALLMTTDALRRVYPFAQFMLTMPYIPYARQDRVCNPGEALSIKVFGQLINSMQYSLVQVMDPHSPVSVACLDNVHIVEQYELFKDIKLSFLDTYIVAPDQGATKKCEEFAKKVSAAGVITCMKHRELKTGKITGMEIVGSFDLYQRKLLVLDDICDGGRTFIELAAILREQEPAKLELAVTHGIFSKGVDVVAEHYDHVYTTDSFRSDLVESDKLSVLEL